MGEDCSDDKTRSICDKYAEDYGDKIKLFAWSDKNTGLITNYMRTIEISGKYIAICDGDCWIRLDKDLQCGFLESNQIL
jgi:glycosyltransferase involved in cell wall biosynthesis